MRGLLEGVKLCNHDNKARQGNDIISQSKSAQHLYMIQTTVT